MRSRGERRRRGKLLTGDGTLIAYYVRSELRLARKTHLRFLCRNMSGCLVANLDAFFQQVAPETEIVKEFRHGFKRLII